MPLRDEDIRRRFDHAAAGFDDFDFVHATTREGLLERLEPMRVQAKTIVDLGCATGSAMKALARRFRGSRIVAVDQSPAMLQFAAGRKPWFTRTAFLQADARRLPLAAQSVDLVFCNQLLPWIDDPAALFVEVNRVLRKEGLFLFAGLGPDSLAELRRAWSGAADDAHVNRFPDMHDLGDAAVRAGLSDPVLDIDRLRVRYDNPAALFRDLTGCGGRNCLADRRRSLTGKTRFAAVQRKLQGGGGLPIELELELVYGHCWGSGPRQDPGEVRIDPARIRRRR